MLKIKVENAGFQPPVHETVVSVLRQLIYSAYNI